LQAPKHGVIRLRGSRIAINFWEAISFGVVVDRLIHLVIQILTWALEVRLEIFATCKKSTPSLYVFAHDATVRKLEAAVVYKWVDQMAAQVQIWKMG
jgi:hypothetical protein